jgi:hypothetical protein
MHVEFVDRQNGPERLVCEAEIIFDETGPLGGMKLVGFSLWRNAEKQVTVTFPARAFGSGSERKFFDLLRPANAAAPDLVRRVKDWIVGEYRLHRAA